MVMIATAMQKTLRTTIHCTGIGLHSGVKAAMTLRPAPADAGIVFRRLDGPLGPVEIRANWSSAADTPLCSMLTDRHGTTIMTVEHLMAALAGCAVDNCIIEIIGPEVPIMDGSAGPFVFLIECAGIVEQNRPRRAIKVLKRVEVGDARCSASIEPDDGFTIDFEIDFASRAINRQTAILEMEPASFKTDISRARTFGFLAEVDQLRVSGRALGASLDNAVVIDGDRIVNEGGLRYADEFVRHKILDAVGDLYLAGAPLLGRFTGRRSSHAMNRRLLQALFSDGNAWAETEIPPRAASLAADFLAEEWQEPARATA